ncbi:hypothetical protein K523DRAFT_86227 [Schizophyllum commune Tattone D]|nr:hypothetical protein K523DRAFT_86227 [Schizophyllum commune Tattone D]
MAPSPSSAHNFVLGALSRHPRALGGPPRGARAGGQAQLACVRAGSATACPRAQEDWQRARPDLPGGRAMCGAPNMAKGRWGTRARTSLAMPTKQGHHGDVLFGERHCAFFCRESTRTDALRGVVI